MTALAPSQILRWNGTKWVNIPYVLNSLTDVATTAPNNGNVLQWNSTTSKWTPTVKTLASNNDYNNAVPATNKQALIFNDFSNRWTPTTINLNSLNDVLTATPLAD